MEFEGGLETRGQDFPRLNDLLYLVEHFYPLMDSHLTSPRLALLGRFIIHDPLLNREYFPSTVPFFFGYSRKRASPFYARVIFYALCRALSSSLSRRHCRSSSSSSSFFSTFPSLPLPCSIPFLNFKRTIIEEIVILIFVISFYHYAFIDRIDID